MKAAAIIAAILIAGAWAFSYAVYPVIARQAYSGASTELFAFDGRLVFFAFDKYAGVGPPRFFSISFNPRSSRMAERIRMEFTAPSPWSGVAGFTSRFDAKDAEYGDLEILAVPFWSMELLLLVIAAAATAYDRLGRSGESATEPDQE